MRTTNVRGFTLIETLMAMVVLAMAATALCTALTAAAAEESAARSKFQATVYARAAFEEAGRQSLSQLDPAPGATTRILSLSQPDDADAVNEGTLRYWQRTDTQPAAGLAVIEVKTRMPDGQTVTLRRLTSSAGRWK